MPDAVYRWRPGTIRWTSFLYFASDGIGDFAVDDGSVIFCIPEYDGGHIRSVVKSELV